MTDYDDTSPETRTPNMPDDSNTTPQAPAAVQPRTDPPAEAPEDARAPEATTADTTTEDEAARDPLAAARKEAAGYRRRLRDAEAERDQARHHAQAAQRAEAERLAQGADLTGRDAENARVLARGQDLWAAGTDLDALIGDDGRVDPAKVREATRQVLGDHPHWGQRLDATIPPIGVSLEDAGLTRADEDSGKTPSQRAQDQANQSLAGRLKQVHAPRRGEA